VTLLEVDCFEEPGHAVAAAVKSCRMSLVEPETGVVDAELMLDFDLRSMSRRSSIFARCARSLRKSMTWMAISETDADTKKNGEPDKVSG
jgi:predicted metal-dependent HD superfamily phosphohydrolase